MRTTLCLTLLAAVVAAASSGCHQFPSAATPEHSPGVELTATSSARVQVYLPQLRLHDGALELAGTIAKQPGASTTAFSHVDILFEDREGKILATTPLAFFPRWLGPARFSRGLGRYSLPLASLPPGTAKISVQGHDRGLAVPHS